MRNEALSAFLEEAQTNKRKKKTVLVSSNSKKDILYYLIEGIAIVSKSDSLEYTIVLERMLDGNFFGAEEFLSGDPKNDLSVTTKTECEFAFMEYEKLRGFILECPEFKEILIKESIRRAAMYRETLFRRVTMDIPGRLGTTLLELTKHPDAVNCPEGIKIHLTQVEISELVYCSRETVSRLLKKFVKKGLIIMKNKDIFVLAQ